MTLKVGFQGNNGTFSEIAALKYFEGKDIRKTGYRNFVEIMNDVDNGVLDYAVLPVENTTTGIIARTYDLFKYYHVHAVGEIVIPIRENLIVLPGTKLSDIREVYSHPEALSQCQNLFLKHPNFKQIPWQDTASSVKYVKDNQDPSKAALASWLAAEYYGMESLMENVQDSMTNVTRFLIVTNRDEIPEDADKISMMLVLKHEPGSLYQALSILADAGVNLLKLESRPIPGKMFEYLFYIDFTGNTLDPQMRETLKKLDERCLESRILGCYKGVISVW